MKKVLRFLKSLMQKIDDDNIIAHAYQLTYSLLVAAFPFIIFLFTLLGFTQLNTDVILQTLSTYLPNEIFEPLAEIIDEVVGKQRGGLLSVSVLLAIWTSSAGFRSLMVSLDKAFGSLRRRPIWRQYLLSIGWVIVFTLFIILAMISMVFGNLIIDTVEHYLDLPIMSEVGRLFLTVVFPVILLFVLMLLMYRFIPTDKITFRRAFPAAVFTTVVWSLFTYLFRIYVTVFVDYSRFYGALGSIVGLLFWLLITSIIILLGAVIAGKLPKRKRIDN